MGIEGFLKRVKDAGLGTYKDLGHSGQSRHSKAIVDGPSLAHYIYSKLNDRPIADGSIAPKTTYKAIAISTLEWLDRLQSYGFELEAIFFDGALPLSKRATRLQRISKYIQNLAAYQKVYHETHKRVGHGKLSGKQWDNSPLIKARKEAPPPPFLVAAVLETLLGSRYANLIFVVSDEADRYCAAAARLAGLDTPELGVSIFTNDSDLIVFDVGIRTAIVLLNDLREMPSSSTEENVLFGTEFRPQDIMDKYNLSSLLKTAFLMKSSRSMTFSEAVRLSNGLTPHFDFERFAQEFSAEDGFTDYQVLRADESTRRLANDLDARVSELVQQVVASTKDTASESANMYLPVLLEDTNKASAWAVGTFWRSLAYQVLLMTYGRPSMTIHEHKRHASRVVGTPLELLGVEGVDSALSIAQQWLDFAMKEDETLTKVERWRFLVIELMIQDMKQQGIATTPTANDITLVLAGRPTCRWDIIHLSARYQAMFYSMRICLQVLRFAQGTKPSLRCSMQGFDTLLGTLDGLPNVSDFLEPVLDITKAVSAGEWQRVLEKYESVYAHHYEETDDERIEEDIIETAFGVKRKLDDFSEDEPRNDSLTGNPFAALADA